MDIRDYKLNPVYSAEAIAKRIDGLGIEINRHYKGEDLLVICVLKGAVLFFSDLVRRIEGNVELDFVRIASYGKSSTSSGSINFSKDLETSLEGKHVLVVEDVIDSGLSMRFLLGQFKARNPKSLKLAAFIDKRECCEADVVVDFTGFKSNDGFIVGYGLDYAESFRQLPGIYELELPS